jgi:type II secretory pathway pseudopilin PulG
VVLGLAVVAILAAAAFPELAPLVVQAAVPGAALAVLAAALRFVLDERSPTQLPTPTRGPAAVVSASSLTQVAPQPSLIIKPLSDSQAEGPTAAGRDLP